MDTLTSKDHNVQDTPLTVVVLTLDFEVTDVLFNFSVIPVTVFTSMYMRAFVALYGIEIDLDTIDAEDTLREVNTSFPGNLFSTSITVPEA